VLILTDDQRSDTLWAMPTVQRELADRGITFANGYVSNPLCCPSRASILTGQYSHSTGVYTNRGQEPFGGFRAFDDGSTVATWLQDAGYRTAMLGKYMNGYAGSYVPPGWDEWFATYQNGGFYDYVAADDYVMKTYGSDRGAYGTTVLAENAVDFIRTTPADTPLFLYFAPHAPHEPATAAPGDGDAFADLEPWRPESYDEADISDKPAYIQRRYRLSATERAGIDRFRRSQYRSLLAVDRTVGEIVDALEATDRLSNTLIVFTSDNGMLWGEHRWDTKLVPYEESIRVPFVLRFDAAIRTPRTDERLVLNIDLAPTFADLAGIAAPRAEGRSITPLLFDEARRPPWRNDFLLEHMEKSAGGVPTYCGVHTGDRVFVRYVTGEEELYDLARDPAQLENLAGDERYAPIRREMLRRLRELCDPAPPGLTLRRA
jgi:arylsulfatase A-like enzyme